MSSAHETTTSAYMGASHHPATPSEALRVKVRSSKRVGRVSCCGMPSFLQADLSREFAV
jgi:hypothetical protein